MKKCKVKKHVLEPKKVETAIRRAKKDLIEFADMLVLKSFFDWCGKYNPRNSFYP